ncbi:MAG: hypothetical protein KC502_02755 [Myxococcales bacterium]|nr:hypothetical protein [Myxococcales bacterium]
MNNSPWLDLERRPQRRHLLQLQRTDGPISASASVHGLLSVRVRERWATLVGVSARSILPCAHASQALSLAAHGALIPSDRVRLARPGSMAWPAAILATGASYIDMGRLNSGALDPSVVTASTRGRFAILGAPAPTGAMDARSWPAANSEPCIWDATLAASLYGAPAERAQPADLALIALRDPLAPSAPVLVALVGDAAHIDGLQSLAGPSFLPASLLRTALGVLSRIDPAASANFALRMAERAAELRAEVALGPGQSWLPQAGVMQSACCLAADGESLVAAAQRAGFEAAAWTAFPGGGLVRCALT